MTQGQQATIDKDRELVWLVEKALEIHLTSSQQTGTTLWWFTKTIREAFRTGVDPEDVFDCIAPAMNAVNAWPRLGIADPEDAYLAFVLAWDTIKWRSDETPIETALALLKELSPIPLPVTRLRKRSSPGYDRFLSLVLVLQYLREEKPIFLPVRHVAEVLATDVHMISIWRQTAAREGILETTRRHVFKPGQSMRATEFRVAKVHQRKFNRWMERDRK